MRTRISWLTSWPLALAIALAAMTSCSNPPAENGSPQGANSRDIPAAEIGQRPDSMGDDGPAGANGAAAHTQPADKSTSIPRPSASPSANATKDSSMNAPFDPASNRSLASGRDQDTTARTETATFGGGCFWCTEAVLEQLDGVQAVQSGYMGGHVDNPTYKQICTGTTNHAEVVQVRFDPKVISYEKLLEWFFRSHDPTTLDRQGADVGTQYRSVVFFHSEEQEKAAAELIRKIAPNWPDPIVTQVSKAVHFWEAEGYHQDYYRNNASQGYCRVVIRPKLEKLGLDPRPAK